LGQRENALTSAQEAVPLYRELATQRSDSFQSDLGGSLINAVNWLSASVDSDTRSTAGTVQTASPRRENNK